VSNLLKEEEDFSNIVYLLRPGLPSKPTSLGFN
jgi:hypothetical protein